MNRTALAVAAAILLTACAPVYYVKPGAGPDEFEADKAACQAQALAGRGDNVFLAIEIVKLCLRGKGWQVSAPLGADAP